jgi:hypothetical protein
MANMLFMCPVFVAILSKTLVDWLPKTLAPAARTTEPISLLSSFFPFAFHYNKTTS